MGYPRFKTSAKLWMDVLITDAVLEKLCRSSDGEYNHDPIAMSVACITDPDKFSKAEDKIWKRTVSCFTLRSSFLPVQVCI